MADSTASSPRLSLVVPLFNEEDNVIPLVEEVSAALQGWDFELVLVDDGSTDNTVMRIPRHPWVHVLAFEANTGQSAAMYAGLMAARGELLGLIDGDLQNDPADLPRLVALIEQGADLACGWRARRQDSWSKRWQSRVANAIRQRFTRDGVHDTGCSLKVMRRACRDALLPFTGMHRFIPALVAAAGYRVVELPVNHRPRRHGQSKYGLANRAFRAAYDLIGVTWICRRRFRYRLREGGRGRR
ncbi:MAG: glycosyltransferase family 2 protein [Verrucomicrobiales bacterium]